MKTIFYLIILSFAFTQVRSQSTYSLELDGVEASACILTKDSCILIAGSADVNGSYVAKLDSNGNILWDRIYKNSSAWPSFDCATATNDSGFVLVGHSGSTYQTFYLKINAIGDTVWTGAIQIGANYVNSVQETIDHGFIFSTTDIIVKIDSNGVFQWAKNFRKPNYGFQINNFKQSSDSSYYLCGGLELMQGSSYPGFGVLMKLDVNGNILWCKTYTDTASSIRNIVDFEFTSTGMILISDLQWDETVVITVDNVGVVNTVKRDGIPAQGAYRYSKIIKRNNTQYFIETSEFMSGGLYLIDSIGNNMGSILHGFDNSDFCIINNNLFFLEINNGYSTGLIKLDTSFQSMCLYNSGASPSIDYSVISDTVSLTSTDTLNAFHFPVSDSAVNYFTYTRCIELSLAENKAADSYSIYPNPSSGYISIGSLNGKMPEEIEINSLLGNKITRINSIDTDMHRIELHLNSGVYFVKIKRDHDFEIHRLIIE